VYISFRSGTFVAFLGSEADLACLERLATHSMGLAPAEYHDRVLPYALTKLRDLRTIPYTSETEAPVYIPAVPVLEVRCGPEQGCCGACGTALGSGADGVAVCSAGLRLCVYLVLGGARVGGAHERLAALASTTPLCGLRHCVVCRAPCADHRCPSCLWRRTWPAMPSSLSAWRSMLARVRWFPAPRARPSARVTGGNVWRGAGCVDGAASPPPPASTYEEPGTVCGALAPIIRPLSAWAAYCPGRVLPGGRRPPRMNLKALQLLSPNVVVVAASKHSDGVTPVNITETLDLISRHSNVSAVGAAEDAAPAPATWREPRGARLLASCCAAPT
jgi:hypothetical protein